MARQDEFYQPVNELACAMVGLDPALNKSTLCDHQVSLSLTDSHAQSQLSRASARGVGRGGGGGGCGHASGLSVKVRVLVALSALQAVPQSALCILCTLVVRIIPWLRRLLDDACAAQSAAKYDRRREALNIAGAADQRRRCPPRTNGQQTPLQRRSGKIIAAASQALEAHHPVLLGHTAQEGDDAGQRADLRGGGSGHGRRW